MSGRVLKRESQEMVNGLELALEFVRRSPDVATAMVRIEAAIREVKVGRTLIFTPVRVVGENENGRP